MRTLIQFMKLPIQFVVRAWYALHGSTRRALDGPFTETPAHRELWRLSQYRRS